MTDPTPYPLPVQVLAIVVGLALCWPGFRCGWHWLRARSR